MLFWSWFFILFLSIPVHCDASYSFVNLIPNILVKGRSVIDPRVDNTVGFNTASTIFHLEKIYASNQSNCSEDLRLFVRDLNARKLWAIKSKRRLQGRGENCFDPLVSALDAWGKIPSGVLQGNIFWVGSAYECQHHLRGWNQTFVEQPLKTHTCTIGNGIFSKDIEPVYGLCVPQTCNATQIADYLHRGT